MVSPTQLCWRYHSLPLSQWTYIVIVMDVYDLQTRYQGISRGWNWFSLHGTFHCPHRRVCAPTASLQWPYPDSQKKCSPNSVPDLTKYVLFLLFKLVSYYTNKDFEFEIYRMHHTWFGQITVGPTTGDYHCTCLAGHWIIGLCLLQNHRIAT